jgi:hypothetical protein
MFKRRFGTQKTSKNAKKKPQKLILVSLKIKKPYLFPTKTYLKHTYPFSQMRDIC